MTKLIINSKIPYSQPANQSKRTYGQLTSCKYGARILIAAISASIILSGCGEWVLRADFDNYSILPATNEALEGPIKGKKDKVGFEVHEIYIHNLAKKLIQVNYLFANVVSEQKYAARLQYPEYFTKRLPELS